MTYPNGKLPDSALGPIPGGRLRKDAAQAYNAMANYAYAHGGGRWQPVTDSYRPLGRPGDLARGRWSQWAAKERQLQGGNLAAQPGTSNHGWGVATDEPTNNIALIARYGARFGWDHRWSDAPSEAWHHRWAPEKADKRLIADWAARGPYGRPPIVQHGDTMRRGSTGPGVTALQRRLRKWGCYPRPLRFTRKLGPLTERRLKQFQARHKLNADGIAGPVTWHLLDQDPARPRPVPDHAAPKPRGTQHQAPRPKPTSWPVTKPPSRGPAIRGRIDGPDVHDGQGDINWHKVRQAGCEFAIARCTMGVRGSESFDTRFNRGRWEAIRGAGLIRGAYHYARPAHDRTGKQEADHFLDRVKACGGFQPGDLRPILDLEQSALTPAGTRNWVGEFVDRVHQRIGVRPIIYTGAFWRDHMPPGDFGCPLWLAAYVSSPGQFVPSSWRVEGWSMWQWTEKGRCPGVTGGCDLNVVRDRAALERLRIPTNHK